MKMNATRISVWISVVALAVAILSYRAAIQATPPSKSARVLFLAGGESPFWQLTAAGAKAAAEQYKVKLTVHLPEDRPNSPSGWRAFQRKNSTAWRSAQVRLRTRALRFATWLARYTC